MSKISNPVFFNDTNLETIPGLTILRSNPYKPAHRNVSMSQLTHSDRGKVNSANYDERVITIGVEISRATRALAEQSIDALMAILQPIDKSLVIPQSGGLRMYYATYSGEPDIIQAGGSYVEMDLTFECSDKFGYDVGTTLLLNIVGYTSSYRSDQLTFIGSTLWQAPIIVLTYSAITGGTNGEVRVGNSGTGQELSITRNWLAGDVITIDPLGNTGSGSVKVNGAEVEFSGAVPMWKKGPGYWYYSDSFTARTFSGQINQYGRYV